MEFIVGFIIIVSRLIPELGVSTTIMNYLNILTIYCSFFFISFKSRKISSPNIIKLYTIIILFSSFINSGEYPFRDFLVGLSIYLIPVFFSIVINPLQKFNYTSYIKGIINGALLILIYALIFGEFDETVLGRRFTCGSITSSVMTILLLLIYVYGGINYFRYRKKIHICFMLFSVLFAILTISKSALVSILVISLFYLYFSNQIKKLLPFILVLVLILLCLEGSEYINTLLEYIDGGGSSSFTGRDTIWIASIDLGLKEPILGHGYNSIVSLLEAATHRIGLVQAHNTFVESFVNIGAIGTFVLLLIFIYSIHYCIKVRAEVIEDDNMMFNFFVVIIFLLRSVTEAGCAQATNLIEVSVFFNATIYIINHSRLKKVHTSKYKTYEA